jgi:microcystin degradation protein MlrC
MNNPQNNLYMLFLKSSIQTPINPVSFFYGKIYLLLSILLLIFGSCQNNQEQSADKKPRIAIAGIAIESSTFSPAVTHEPAFRTRKGQEVFTYYPFMHKDSTLRNQAQWFPTLRGHAIPGGIVTKEAYESLVKPTLDRLRENLPYDGLYLDIHGAMSVQGLDDPEGDFIKRIRQVVGKETLISTCMDLHGNVSPQLARHTDLITCYRMAPHEDAIESKRRAVANLLARLKNGKGKPAYKAWIPVPILLPGEKTSTRIEPAKTLYAQVAPTASQEGIIDAAIWVGYAWADEPRNHAAVMVTGDQKEAVTEAAEKLATHFWHVRNEFEFVAPVATLKECLDKAIASNKAPFIISDMGDNPTAGGAGDVTWTLQKILERSELQQANGPSLIYASIPGPEFVDKALAIGEGGTISATAGARIDNRYAPPVQLNGTIEKIKQGDKDAVTEVVVKVGSVQVIVTRKRKPYHHEKDFTELGLNPRESDIVVVKIGYLVTELYNMRADWLMALTPGGVDQDLKRLPYKRIKRPMFPLDSNMEDPDLHARLIPASDSDEDVSEIK